MANFYIPEFYCAAMPDHEAHTAYWVLLISHLVVADAIHMRGDRMAESGDYHLVLAILFHVEGNVLEAVTEGWRCHSHS